MGSALKDCWVGLTGKNSQTHKAAKQRSFLKGAIMLTKGLILGSIALAVVLSSTPIVADEMTDMKAEMKRLQTRLDKMENEKVGTIHKEEMAKMMKDILDDAKVQPAMPAWMKNLTFYGDFMLQYQHDHVNGRNGPWGMAAAGGGQVKDRNRIRMRLRFGFTKTWWDKQLEVGFRLVTGTATGAELQHYQGNLLGPGQQAWINPDGSDPTESEQTMTGTFSKKPIWVDLMYGRYKPKWAKGLTITGGKMLNPFKTQTMMTWDPDVNPEGLTAHYQAPFFGDFKPYTAFGFWILGENAWSGTAAIPADTLRDVTLWTYELGLDWQINKDMAYFVGVTYYQFDHVDSTTYYIPTAGVDNAWRNQSNRAAADYSLLELTTRFEWKMFNLPWQVWFSWVRNCADDYSVYKNPVAVFPNPAADRHFQDDPNAYGVGIVIGENAKKGDWSANYSYLYEEYGSVIAGLTDSDFAGPNRKGHVIGAKYNIDDFLTIGTTLFIKDPIHTNDNNIPGSNHNLDQITELLVDLTWEF
jgi:hypothetical protein